MTQVKAAKLVYSAIDQSYIPILLTAINSNVQVEEDLKSRNRLVYIMDVIRLLLTLIDRN